MGIRSLELVDYVYKASPEERRKAKRAILQHDPDAFDIIEILGLDNE